MSNRQPRMLVTGASGLLGANFCLVARREYQITACSMRHALALDGVATAQLDLRDLHRVELALDRSRPEIIVHFAAATDVNRCEAHPKEAEEHNVVATRHLAEWAGRRSARFLLMSTDSVFDGERGAYTENDSPSPINRYAETKLRAERIVTSALEDSLVVRASIYGWNAQPKQSLAEWALARLQASERVPGFVDVYFAPLLANTLADIMLTLLRQARKGLYHAASRDTVSKYEFVRAIADEFSLAPDLVDGVTIASISQAARRPLNSSLDARRLSVETAFILPTVREDLRRFRLLAKSGIRTQLQHACRRFNHE
jgi:dTDP-4-dehydrorhamnose reductase